MPNQLANIFRNQRQFQELLGFDFENMTDEERMEYIRSQNLALQDELHEALAETGWKPWASSNHINREAYAGELVDALHFFVNLCLIAGITWDELYAGYMEKIVRNISRQRNGYDGVSNKCPQCKRAMDDIIAHGEEPVRTDTGMEFCSLGCVADYNRAGFTVSTKRNTVVFESADNK